MMRELKEKQDAAARQVKLAAEVLAKKQVN